MKSYTDIQQSKKLAEILPEDSADQTWEIIAIAGANLDVPEEMEYWHNGNIVHLLVGCIAHCLAGIAGLIVELKNLKVSPTGCLCHNHQKGVIRKSRTTARKEARNELCKHYRSWVDTSRGEINCACVDEEKRTITKCDYTESKGCWMCPRTTKSQKEVKK